MKPTGLDGAMFEVFKAKAQALEDRGASPEEWRELQREVRAYEQRRDTRKTEEAS